MRQREAPLWLMGLGVCLCLVEDGASCVWLEGWGPVRGGEEREMSFG